MNTATQENRGCNTGTSEGGGREKLKKVDCDFPACMRPKKTNNDNNTRRNEDLKGKGGGRLKHFNVDGDVPPCLGNIDEESKDGSSSKKNSKEKTGRKEAKAKRQAEAKICAAIQLKRKKRKWENKKQGHRICRATEEHEINALN